MNVHIYVFECVNIFLRNEQRRECDVVVFWKIYFLIILIFSQLSKQTITSYINVSCVCVCVYSKLEEESID